MIENPTREKIIFDGSDQVLAKIKSMGQAILTSCRTFEGFDVEASFVKDYPHMPLMVHIEVIPKEDPKKHIKESIYPDEFSIKRFFKSVIIQYDSKRKLEDIRSLFSDYETSFSVRSTLYGSPTIYFDTGVVCCYYYLHILINPLDGSEGYDFGFVSEESDEGWYTSDKNEMCQKMKSMLDAGLTTNER